MPRNARKNLCSQFFHVMVQGLNKEYIFEKEIDIKVYLRYLKEKLEGKNLQMIAYCIMNNHAHFLIQTEDVKEISKLMSQVNTKYAIFYNKKYDRCGFVFRNRYKSEEIMTYAHLLACIEYIHNNPVKAKMCEAKADYPYSSFGEYKGQQEVLLNITAIAEIFKGYGISLEDALRENYKLYRFLEDVERQDKEKVKEDVLREFCQKRNMGNKEDIVTNDKYFRELVSILYIEYRFTQKEIAEMLGVSKFKINRMLNAI